MPEQIPKSEELEFKDKFVEKYSKLTDFNKFKEYSLAFLRRSIRVNTLKISVNELKQRLSKNWNLETIPWCKEGFWIEHKGEEKENKEHGPKDKEEKDTEKKSHEENQSKKDDIKAVGHALEP